MCITKLKRYNDITQVWSCIVNCISSVMVSVFTLCTVDPGFKPRSCQTKEYKYGICCFSANHAALRNKSKDWWLRNQNNVSRVDRYVYLLTVVSMSQYYIQIQLSSCIVIIESFQHSIKNGGWNTSDVYNEHVCTRLQKHFPPTFSIVK